jgi:uncharacterized protein YecE (DUF72 family)
VIYVGTAGFSYKDWEGIVYPKALAKAKRHALEYIAPYFDCCEINTTFYGHLKPELAKRWCALVRDSNPDFQFTAKLNKAFTHAPAAQVNPTSAKTLNPQSEDEKLARAGLDALAAEHRLGALLAQFPISFKNTDENRKYLEALIKRFSDYPLVVEVRHSTWNEAEVLAAFAQMGVAFCNIDQPLLGKAIRPSTHVTSPIGYVRLHGRNYKEWFESDNRDDRYNYLYTVPEVKKWTERAKEVGEKAEKTFVVTNNHYKGKAAANALEIKSLLKGKKVKGPQTLVDEYPELEDFVEP